MGCTLRAGVAGAALAALIMTAHAQAPPPASPPAAQPPPPMTQAPPPEAAAPAAPPEAAPERAPMQEPARPADNQIADLIDARIAQLKADLRLTADQDGSWPAVRDALRDYGFAAVKSRYAFAERIGRRDPYRGRGPDQTARADDIAVMRWEADDLAIRANGMKKIADAAEPLYRTLGDRQRRLLVRFIQRGLYQSER